jgi:hypothetical protein
MGRIRGILGICAGAGGLLLLAAARPPGAIALASPGLWEFTGLPTAGGAARQCLANTASLARLEHREAKCTETVISQTASTTRIEYSCANGGYGQTKVTVLTPRSLRIETQGISANLPFNYKIQARRVGDCPPH